jgi:hypothetical protein
MNNLQDKIKLRKKKKNNNNNNAFGIWKEKVKNNFKKKKWFSKLRKQKLKDSLVRGR